MSQSSHNQELKLDDCWNRIGVWGDGECPELQQYVHCRNCPVYSKAAGQLLDRELPPGYLNGWTRHFSSEIKATGLETHSAVIFRIGAEWLALPTSVLQEIAERRVIHTLPHRRDTLVLGLVNVRGELLICVSLAEVLGADKVAAEKATGKQVVFQRFFVAQRDDSRLVFPVDEVYGIHHYNPEDLQPPPATVSKAKATYTQALLIWQEKPVGLLDDQLLFYTLNRSLA